MRDAAALGQFRDADYRGNCETAAARRSASPLRRTAPPAWRLGIKSLPRGSEYCGRGSGNEPRRLRQKLLSPRGLLYARTAASASTLSSERVIARLFRKSAGTPLPLPAAGALGAPRALLAIIFAFLPRSSIFNSEELCRLLDSSLMATKSNVLMTDAIVIRRERERERETESLYQFSVRIIYTLRAHFLRLLSVSDIRYHDKCLAIRHDTGVTVDESPATGNIPDITEHPIARN